MPRTLVYLLCLVTLALSACGGSSSGDAPVQETLPQTDTLPPDPGPEGTATVEGIDADGDGVRDDIQRYIAFAYPDSAKKRAALTQLAVALQDQLTACHYKEQCRATAARTMRAVECLSSVDTTGTPQTLSTITTDLQAEIFNTQARWDAYRTFDEQLWGEVVSSLPLAQHTTVACTFDPATLPD